MAFKKYKYIWFDTNPNTKDFPIGYTIDYNLFDSKVDRPDEKYLKNNFICRYIKSNTFNLSFRYDNKFLVFAKLYCIAL